MARVYSDEEKEEYLAEYHESGKSKSEFSREKDIPTTTFRRWIDNENRSAYGMIDLNKLDKEKNSNVKDIKAEILSYCINNILCEKIKLRRKIYVEK